ncbi:nucleotidyltransferase substrate binding protein [Magnetovirga frankeli]|uniref:nucleotidyltransferase substrate binding protein n=1 Tax=Magnetovirga frankeli TaxID=947516 RepID=UPI003D333CE3
MTMDIRWKQRFDNFQRALHQLTLAMALKAQRPLSDLEQQGLIQGFEFTHELAWNVLKDYLEMEGIQAWGCLWGVDRLLLGAGTGRKRMYLVNCHRNSSLHQPRPKLCTG